MTAIVDRLDVALSYAGRGLRIFPCHSVREGRCSCGCVSQSCPNRGKHPRMKAWQTVATADAGQVRAWWRRWPAANIAAPMEANGKVALDIDPRNGGAESLRELERDLAGAGEALPETWTNLTGGGGVHLIFDAPADFSSRTDSLAPGIDVKWHGYVILPPSEHKDGGEYQWEIGYGPDDRAAAVLPSSIATRIQAPPAEEDLPPRGAIAELLTRPCPEGQRHNALIRVLGWARNIMTRDEAEAVALAWNAQWCRPALDEEYVSAQVADAYARWSEPGRIDEEDLRGAHAGEEEAAPDADGPFAIIDAVAYKRRPPPLWDVDGILQQRTFAAIVGDPGSGKSFVGLDIAASKAAGWPFLGRRVRRGRVLYVCAEGAGGFGLRIAAWERGRDVELESGWLYILPGMVSLVDNGRVRALIRQVLGFGVPWDMVIFDTLSRNMPGADENAPKDMTAAVAAADLVQRMLRCVVMVLHHGRKSDGNIRGHSSLEGALDTVMVVTRGDDDVVSLACRKQKDGEPFGEILLRPRVIDVADMVGPPVDQQTGEVLEDEIEIGPASTSLVFDEITGDERRERQAARGRAKRAADLTAIQWAVARALYEGFSVAGATHREWMQACRARGMQQPRQTIHGAFERLVELELVRLEARHDTAWHHTTARLGDLIRERFGYA